MAIQLINVGETANDTTGDSLRTAFLKCNANFTELYNATSSGLRAWVITKNDYQAYNGDRVLVNTSLGEVTITLPPNPVQGDWVQIADAWNFSVNNLIIISEQTVEGFAEDIRIDIRGLFVEFIFGDTTWKIITSLGVQGPPGPPGSVEEGRAYNISVTGDDSTVLVDGLTNTINLDGTVRGDIVPDQDSQYDLGSLNLQWKSLYVSNNTIYLGGRSLSLVGDNIAIGSSDGSSVILTATQDYVDAAIGDGVPQTLNDLGIVDGQAGQVLTTDGQGVYTFQTPADASIVPYAVFTHRVHPVSDPYEFTKPSGTDLEDPIDTDLTLTRKRGEGGAIYNSALESVYNASTSPQGTLWNTEGWSNLDDIKSRYYTTFKQAFRNKVGINILGKELVMHDTINNKYYKVKFTQWDVGAGVGGGFQYTRQLLNSEEPVGLTFADGTIQTTAPKDFWDEPQVFVGDTNSYTLGLNDRGHHVYAYNSAIQVPSNLQVAFPIGTTVRIIASSSPVRIIPCECITPSVIYRNGFTDPSGEWVVSAYSSSTLTKVDINTWRLTSDDALAGTGGGGDGNTSPVLPYVELTNNPVIFEPYSGELISFTKEDYATGAEATDEVDTGLAITRGNQRGIYNPYLEPAWDNSNNDGTSPAGTLWNKDGWTDLTNLADRRYFSFYEVNLGRIGNNVLNTEFVMKDVANNRYYKFIFTVWGQSWQGAPVSYTRTEIDAVTGEDIGEPVEFVKPGGSDPALVNDPIDTDLTITRGNNQGIYNIALETSWSEQGDGEDSPEGTLWNSDGWGRLDDVKQRNYVTWQESLGYAVGENIINTELVMWDTINDKYWAIKFSSWTQGGDGGGFSYTRQQINTSQIFVKSNYGDEVDEISEGLHITRGEYGWLYNPLEDEGYGDDTPTGSLWNNDGWDDFSDVESRTYIPLATIWGGRFQGIPGARMVMKDTTTDKYWAIQFLTWTAGNGGGFSYLRYELDLTQLNEGVKFADGTVLKTAIGVGRVKSTASGNRRIEEAAGSKTISVTEKVAQPSVAGTSWDTRTDYYVYLVWDQDLYNLYNGPTNPSFEVSVDNNVWYSARIVGAYNNNWLQIYLEGDRQLSVTQGEPLYYRVVTGGEPIVWWDKNDLPGGGGDFRGAVIDYHAYTGDATFIGTIHIVDDDGEEHITHTEVSSGGSDSENDDLWIVQNEGTISYRRIDGESRTLKVHWTAKVFYGSEYYD